MTTEENTAAETVRAILDRGRAADDLGKLCRRLRLAPDEIEAIADAVRHCPRAIVGAGRALAHGGRARGIVGPDPSVCPADHLIHAADHVDAAGDDLADTTDTGLRHLDHAIARLMLAREVTA